MNGPRQCLPILSTVATSIDVRQTKEVMVVVAVIAIFLGAATAYFRRG